MEAVRSNTTAEYGCLPATSLLDEKLLSEEYGGLGQVIEIVPAYTHEGKIASYDRKGTFSTPPKKCMVHPQMSTWKKVAKTLAKGVLVGSRLRSEFEAATNAVMVRHHFDLIMHG
jgi:transcriptional accessory protein Tex/SPT6